MKSFWNTKLGETVSSSSAALTALKSQLQAAGTQQDDDAGGAGASSTASGDTTGVPEQRQKQYLRLPVESARKLRWFDKDDLQATVRSHLAEKRELNETITALKLALVRHGVPEAELSAEVAYHLERAEDIAEGDEGVNSVLLASLQDGFELLKGENAGLHQQLDEARAHGGMGTHAHGGMGMGMVPADLAARLLDSFAQLESSNSAISALSRQIRDAEVDVSVACATHAMRAMVVGGAATAEPGQSLLQEAHAAAPEADDADQQLNLMERLQRTEIKLARATERVSELEADLAAVREAAEADVQRAAVAANAMQSELEAAHAARRTAEDAAAARATQLKKMQQSAQGAEALRRYQDICLAAEERAAAAERMASLMQARCDAAEAAAKDAASAQKASERALEAARAEATEAQARATAAERARSSAAAAGATGHGPGGGARSGTVGTAPDSSSSAAAAEAAARELRAARTAASNAEARTRAAEAREAQLMAELREAEMAIGDRDDLAAQVMVLRDKLADQRAEAGQLEHLRTLVAELQANRDVVQEELVVTAQLVTQLEAKLRDALERIDEAETAAQAADGRARDAANAVTREVELRLAAAVASRSSWPLLIREEVERLEARLEALQATLSAAQTQLASSDHALEEARAAGAAASAEADSASAAAQAAVARQREAVEELEAARNEAADARAEAAAARQDAADATRKASAAGEALLRQSSLADSGAGGGGGGGHPKWQVQNTVGGGSLYGITDAAAHYHKRSTSNASNASGSQHQLRSGATGSTEELSMAAASPRQQQRPPALQGVDMVYLKNVLLKFMEAAMTGKVAEREVMLPAVAALLQATPAEFQVLKRLVNNTTTPAGQQMLEGLQAMASRAWGA